MTEMLRQSLSAVMDDEADAFELRRVLDELDRDPDLRGVWTRYHLIGAAMRGERARRGAGGADPGLRDRVWEALADSAAAPDAAVTAGDGTPAAALPRFGGWAGRLTGLAVAATVAFAVVVGFDAMRPAETLTPGVAAVEPVAVSPVPVADTGLPRARLAAEVSPSDLRRAQAYMLHHAQQQALNQAGMMSLVKMATYEKP